MTARFSLALIGAGVLLLTLVGNAAAGGFTRGTADTNILFKEDRIAARAGVTIVSPTRRYSRNPNNPDLVGHDIVATHAIPSAAVKVMITDNLRCAGTFVTALGGHAQYDAPKNAARPTPMGGGIADAGKTEEEFTIDETGVTCAVSFELGPGNFYVLGGAFQERFDYDRKNTLTAYGLPGTPDGTPVGKAHLTYDDIKYGFRLGAAYEIPDIALRAVLLYRSGTSYRPKGELDLATPAGVSMLEAHGKGDLPQSIELSLQSGIAKDWLAYGWVKWTDWSVTTQFISQSYWAPGVPGPGDTNDYFWRDGWTLSGGVGHNFHDRLSGYAGVTWDEGVATGYDHSSETWSLSGGLSFIDPLGGELWAGGSLSTIAAAKETRYGDANTALEAGWAYALNVGYAVEW